MIRAISVATLVLCLGAMPVMADDAGRHSGRVVEMRDGGKSFLLEEMGPWLGPNTGLATRMVTLAPSITVQVLTATGKWEADASPGYDVQRMTIQELKPGDFVTVTLDTEGRAATALEVMRPTSADGGLASPAGR
jgi:hypothetical protein